MIINPYPYNLGIVHPRLTLVTAPASEPVDLASAKAWCRVEISDDDALITGLIVAARKIVENRLSRSLINTTWDYTLDYFGNGNSSAWYSPLKLPVAAVSSLTSITYRDTSGNSTTLSSAVYRLSSGTPGYVEPVQGSDWPATSPWFTGAVTIRFVAGYGADATSVPDNVKVAIKMLVGNLYENREATTPGTISEVPLAFESLLDSERWYQ